MKCFYHKSDLDGHCSGAIVKLIHPDCEMIGVDYNNNIGDFNFEPGEVVFIVDFSFDIEEMVVLNTMVSLHWIDHHKSAIESAHDVGFLSSGGQNLEIGKAGCELTWEYLHPNETMPLTVHLLGRYDVWDHKNDLVLPFQYGLRENIDTLPDNVEFWERVFTQGWFLESTIEKGWVIIRYENKQNATFAEGMSFEVEFHGLRAIAMNKPHANSKAFDSVYDPEKHDIMILFGVKPGQWKYSIYCDKPGIDVSKIAQKYGGGGHAGAAGFYYTGFAL